MEQRKITEAIIVKETGRRWSNWKEILFYFNAEGNDHKKSVILLVNRYSLTPWWAEILMSRYEKENA